MKTAWPRQQMKLHISLEGGSLGWRYHKGKLHVYGVREKVAHPCQVVAHRRLVSCTKRGQNCTKKISSKYTHVGSSFEEHAARVPTVKADVNFDVPFKNYVFSKEVELKNKCFRTCRMGVSSNKTDSFLIYWMGTKSY